MTKTRSLVSKNGLKILFVEDESIDVVALGLSVGAGVYFEEDGKEGVSHLLEHLIGRSDIDGKDFRETIYSKGGVLEASTSIYKTYYYLTSRQHSFVNLLDIFVQGIFYPKLTEKDLNESKESIVSELAYMEDVEPYKILREMMWKDSKLSKPIVGSKSSIMQMSYKGIEDYHKTHYSAENSSVVIYAPEIPEHVVNTLDKIPAGERKESEDISFAVNTPTYRIFQERNLKSAIAISFPTKGYVGLGEGRHYFNLAAGALSEIYMGDLGSRGLIYDESWVWNVFPENGDFILFLDDIERDHLLPTLEGVIEIVDKWSDKPMDKDKFNIMKEHKILDLKTHTSVSEKIVLLTKSFSSAEEVHTYDEAIEVYQKAEYSQIVESFKNTLLSKKPFIVVSAGIDSENISGDIQKILNKYY